MDNYFSLKAAQSNEKEPIDVGYLDRLLARFRQAAIDNDHEECQQVLDSLKHQLELSKTLPRWNPPVKGPPQEPKTFFGLGNKNPDNVV